VVETNIQKIIASLKIKEEIMAENQNNPEYRDLLEKGLTEMDTKKIDKGMVLVYQLFVQNVIGYHRENLMLLGRTIAPIYASFEGKNSDPKVHHLLGQLRALINLCRYFPEVFISNQGWIALNKSMWAKQILCTLASGEGLLADQIMAKNKTIPNKNCLLSGINFLIKFELVGKEYFGKNILYSATLIGQITAQRLGFIAEI
jgi:hypothetical protein